MSEPILPPGRYYLKQIPHNMELPKDKIVVVLPHGDWPRPGESMLFEVIDPATHDHEGQVNPQHYNGVDYWVCDECGKRMTREEYEIWFFRTQTRKWIEQQYVAYNDDALGEPDELSAVGFYHWLQSNMKDI